METRLAEILAARLGPIATARRVAGGDINDTFEVRLADDRRVFVKTHAAAPRGMFPAEARGLEWLRDAPGPRVPAVVAVADADDDSPGYLVLELIASRPRRASFDEDLGRGLAQLHRAGAPHFGFETPNFIGRLPQENTPSETWPAFYAEHRLLPQARAAVDGGRAPRSWIARFERLAARLPDLAGPAEPPARLHGDLWGGNIISDEQGRPVVIDPAVYGGHREVDLAMLRLFGGPGARLLDAYHEVWPLEPGHLARVRLYQLYPLLVHVNLFGGSYVHAVDSALHACE